MYGLRKNDYFWLRVAAMDDEGFLRGAAWGTQPHVYDRLERLGFVERFELCLPRKGDTFRVHTRAITTLKGLDAVEAKRLGNIERRKKHESVHSSDGDYHGGDDRLCDLQDRDDSVMRPG